MIGTLAVNVWGVTFDTARRGLGGGAATPSPLFAVPNVTAHPSTANVPITVLLHNGPLLYGFNVSTKGLAFVVIQFEIWVIQIMSTDSVDVICLSQGLIPALNQMHEHLRSVRDRCRPIQCTQRSSNSSSSSINTA